MNTMQLVAAVQALDPDSLAEVVALIPSRPRVAFAAAVLDAATEDERRDLVEALSTQAREEMHHMLASFDPDLCGTDFGRGL